ncbi:HlyD family secretion protein [Thiosulfativibrio zosterae]|uniref:Secretion protein HlyD n=1 Tax=Thiosulfativibrio zosterae TaxID=2675053 RepID=A0A6F8PK97_9GAMM|nr:HlyD family efflux transporter periplasmic adaptor subunit [Thiosulfativibrio zosterae]BBP42484.1 secretion protein HlyD [Thiosulfativibrio zosterae]
MQTHTKTRLTVGLLAVIALLLLTSIYINTRSTTPDHLLKVNGRIEAEHYLASTKAAGKILQVSAQEGDWVKAGQVLAVLDDAQVRARVTQAAAAYGAVLAQYKAAQTGLELLKKQVPLQVASAQATVDHAKAMLNSAQASSLQANKDTERYRQLYAKGTIEKHQLESSQLNAEVLRDQVQVAEMALIQAQKALAEADLGDDQVLVKTDEVAAVKALTLQAQASLMEAMSVFEDMKITAPIDGVITKRLVNVGEVVSPGSGLFDLVNLDALYLKGYVAENRIGQIHLNQKADLKVDAFPNQTFATTVTYIASQAEFTPKEVQTQDERVKLVYAVKLLLDANPEHRLMPGIPADAWINLPESH